MPILRRSDDLEAHLVDAIVFVVDYARGHALLQKALREHPELILPALTTESGPLVERVVALFEEQLGRALSQTGDRALTPRAAAEWGYRIVISLITTPSQALDDEGTEAVRRQPGPPDGHRSMTDQPASAATASAGRSRRAARPGMGFGTASRPSYGLPVQYQQVTGQQTHQGALWSMILGIVGLASAVLSVPTSGITALGMVCSPVALGLGLWSSKAVQRPARPLQQPRPGDRRLDPGPDRHRCSPCSPARSSWSSSAWSSGSSPGSSSSPAPSERAADEHRLVHQRDAVRRRDAVADLAREREQVGRGGPAAVGDGEGVLGRQRDPAGAAVEPVALAERRRARSARPRWSSPGRRPAWARSARRPGRRRPAPPGW